MYRASLAALLMVFGAPAWGYKPAPPRSHTTTSADGRFVFVILSPFPLEEEVERWREDLRPEIQALRAKWPVSGMYRNDGSADPLWTVDWYAYKVDVPSDGEHVIRYTSGGWSWKGEPALAFYQHGELVRSYQIPELVTFPALIGHGGWLSEAHLDDASRTVTVRTELGERYVFDVSTGEMVSRFRPLWYAAVALVAGLVGIGYLVWRRCGRRKTAQAARVP
jgi:hypothetical protein